MGYSQKQVAQKVGCCDDIVSKVLKVHNIPIRGSSTKKIDQFDMAGNYIQSFFGSVEVAKWLVEMGLAKKDISQNVVIKKLNLLTGTYGGMQYFHKSRLSYIIDYLLCFEKLKSFIITVNL